MGYKKHILKKKVKIALVVFMSLIICITIGYLIFNWIQGDDEVLGGEGIELGTANAIEHTSKQVDKAKRGSIDVLALGNSDLFSGFNPLQLWHEKGITSYAAGGSMQNMSSTYYMLEEILKYQKPKVLILELDNFFEKRGDDNKAEAKENTYRTCYPLFKYTSLWKQLKNKSYTQKKSANTRTFVRGYYYKTEIDPYKEGYSYMGSKNGEEPVVSYTQKYFPKIMSLAKQNNCQVIFLCFPSRTSWNYKKHNTVSKYAEKYKVPFLDMNVDQYNSGFDWETDTRDAGNHLNHNGATKVTKFLGEYLVDHYNLTDHRENPKFDDWNEDYNRFISQLNH